MVEDELVWRRNLPLTTGEGETVPASSTTRTVRVVHLICNSLHKVSLGPDLWTLKTSLFSPTTVRKCREHTAVQLMLNCLQRYLRKNSPASLAIHSWMVMKLNRSAFLCASSYADPICKLVGRHLKYSYFFASAYYYHHYLNSTQKSIILMPSSLRHFLKIGLKMKGHLHKKLLVTKSLYRS